MARTIELLFHDGILIDTWQSKRGEPRQWGSKEIPKNGYIVVRIYGLKTDLPIDLRLYGGGSSKLKLNESKMSLEEQQLFKDESRFIHMSHTIKHTITPQRLVTLCDDNTAEWNALQEL